MLNWHYLGGDVKPMKRSAWVSTLCAIAVAVSGCGDRTNDRAAEGAPITAADESDAARLLKAGHPAACNAFAVTETVKNSIEDEWLPRGWTRDQRLDFLGGAIVKVHDVIATEVVSEVPRIHCEATYSVVAGGAGGQDRVAYALMLQLDSDLVSVDVDLQRGVAVLDASSTQFEQTVVKARQDELRDSEAAEICDRYQQRRGRWTYQEIGGFISELGDLRNRSDFTLGRAGAECDRLMRADQQEAIDAARIAHNEREQAEEARLAAEVPQKKNRVEYAEPPVIASRPAPTAPPVRALGGIQISWSRRPNAVMPSAAVEAGVTSGSAMLECVVQSSGQLSNCRVLSETPSGFGLGNAAVAAVQRSQLSPRSADSLLEAGSLRFNVRFSSP
jgi:hypothetical protein